METLAIKLYFYSWEIGGKRYNSALYIDENKRDYFMLKSQNYYKGITFLPGSTELYKSDLKAINNAFNK